MGRLITLAIIKHPDGDIHVGTEMYCTRAGDALPNTLFADRIRLAEYERGITYFFWSRSATATPVRTLDLVNTDAFFDGMIGDEWKEVVVELYVAEPRSAFDDATRVGTMVVNNIDTPDEHTFRLNAFSYLEVLDKVVTGKYSDTVTNTQYRSAAKPISLGRVTWSYPINHRLNDPAGSTRGAYDVADSYIEGIVTLRARGALQSERQIPLVTNSYPYDGFYATQNATDGYGFLFRAQEYRFAADVKGQLRLGNQLLAETTFSVDWEDEWGTVLDDGSVTLNSPGSLTIDAYGTGNNYIEQSITTTSGNVYLIEVDVDYAGSGVWSILRDGTAIRSFENVSGKVVATFEATAASHTIAVGFPTGASGQVTLSSVTCNEAFRINTGKEIVRFAVERCGLSASIVENTALESLNAPLAFASTDEVRGIELVRAVEQSLNVSFYQTLDGKLRPVQLLNPGTASEEFTIYETDVDGVVSYEPDLAPGLTTRYLWGKNYNVHSIDDVAGLPATTAGNPALREALQREHKTVTAGEAPIALYSEAADREPLATLHTDESEAQNYANYLFSELFYEAKGFYSLRARVSTIEPYTIEPGNLVKLYNWRYGLSAGKVLVVVYAKSSFHDNYIDLVLWG